MDFLIGPTQGCDVMLGMPWMCRVKVVVPLYGQDVDKLRITHKGKDIVFEVGVQGNSIPLVTHVQIKKAMKSSLCTYLVFAEESKAEDNVNVEHMSNEFFCKTIQ